MRGYIEANAPRSSCPVSSGEGLRWTDETVRQNEAPVVCFFRPLRWAYFIRGGSDSAALESRIPHRSKQSETASGQVSWPRSFRSHRIALSGLLQARIDAYQAQANLENGGCSFLEIRLLWYSWGYLEPFFLQLLAIFASKTHFVRRNQDCTQSKR